MGPLVVVVAQPAGQVGGPCLRAAVWQGVGALAQEGWMKRSALPLVLGLYGRVRRWRSRRIRQAFLTRRET